jgi:HEAT repeat protein
METCTRWTLFFALVLLAGGCSKPQPTTVHGEPISHWLGELHSSDARARKKAVDVLCRVGPIDPSVVPGLIEAVKDRNAVVRAEAVGALMRIGPSAREAVATLVETSKNDRDPKVRSYAAKALEKIQGQN